MTARPTLHRASSPALLCLVAGLALAWCDAASAQWVWRDRNHQLHASDVPPPGDVPDKDITQRPAGARRGAQTPSVLPVEAAASVASEPASAAASAPQDRKLEAEVEARKQKAEQDEKARRKAADDANAAARADNCAKAKRQLAALENGQRIARNDDKGEKYFLDDKQRAEEARRTRGTIDTDCK